MRVSAIVITRNAEPTIRRCLDSLRWADEIVVVDSGSTDRTLDICRELGARVHQTADWPGYGPQKNRALDLATGEWMLSLDSDEWVTPELRAQIVRAIAEPGAKAAFALPRRSSFCGRYMRHSGWWPDYVGRLFRRGAARFSDDQGHDRLIVNGATGRLAAPIYHETITDLDQLIDKMNVYSAMTARNLHARGRRASIVTALLHGGWAFLRTYFLRAGFLDGREGLMLAISNAENSYYRYAKLMLIAEKNGERSTVKSKR
ncbi:MAG: glycosyltransferase family 2 protein [Betaproteobacteria bacterium]|nr:glycosyltransferase family 2 protein [Betaproteobacteria bacterium]